VSRFDAELRKQVDWMRDVMEGANGIGLAATQVGIVESVLVYRVERDSPIVAVINPEIEWRGGETEVAEEGCLSIPGVHVDVERDIHVRVSAVDETGTPYTIEASGLEARVLQHEIDHLDGVLMLDRTTREQRRDAMRAWRELRQTE
jgi:peptide deformylase